MIDAVGEARDELDRILQVIKHTTRHTDIEVRLITLQIRYSITTQKLDTPELQDFLDDQTLQKGPGVGFDGDDLRRAGLFQHVAMAAFKWTEFKDAPTCDPANRRDPLTDSRVLKCFN